MAGRGNSLHAIDVPRQRAPGRVKLGVHIFQESVLALDLIPHVQTQRLECVNLRLEAIDQVVVLGSLLVAGGLGKTAIAILA